MWVNSQYSEEFGVGAGVHQGSVLNPLLFILVLEALLCDFCTGVPWALLFADDLMLITDTQEEWITMLKAGMASNELHVNMKKTKFPSLVMTMMSSRDLTSTPVLSAVVV